MITNLRLKVSIASLYAMLGWGTSLLGQTYFTQDFSSSNTVSDYATGAANRFNAINISSGIAVSTWSIDTGSLKFDKLGLGRNGYLTKTDFASSPNTTLLKFNYKLSSVVGLTSVASIYVGDNFTTATSAPTAGNIHTQVNLYDLLLGTGSLTANQFISISVYINNGSSSIKYVGPNGVLQTLAVDQYDVWSNTIKGTGGSAITGTIPLNDFKIVSSQNIIGSAFFDDFNVGAIPPPTTTWNGSSWSNGVPTIDYIAIIDGNYSGAGFTAQTLTVNSGRTFSPSGTVNTGDMVNNGSIVLGSSQSVVQSSGSSYSGSGNITLNNGGTYTLSGNSSYNGSGNITINDGGNFIQGTGGTYNGTGTFSVNKNNGVQVDKYVFWGIPITQKNVYSLYTGYTSQYAMTYNTATNYYNTLSNPTNSIPGVGYSIKVPNAGAPVSFTGTPNNGNISVPLSIASLNYNLIGNPYPSNINLRNFYLANQSLIGSTFWFWDSSVNPVITQNGNTTQNNGYSTYNAVSQIWVGAPTTTAPTNTTAKIGQGWIVKGSGAGNLVFNNSMRDSSPGVSYNKTNASNEEGKYWLRLTAPYGTFTTQAVSYMQGASSAYDSYDSKALSLGSDAFYSLADTEKVIIQGRRIPFNDNDIIRLGNKHLELGSFTISLDGTEGIFTGEQAIYLHDKQLGTYTNLQNESYTFSAQEGENSNRFEIVYKQPSLEVLESLSSELKEVKVYREADEFVISALKKIEKVSIYDGSGRLVKELNGGQANIKFSVASGHYLLKIKIGNQLITRKITK
ncbi:T9SS C-terminal target domain-containing protein [Chryseobacterium nematophagum]|uniref:T9SS C-terminal target domain-containing protein n=1 Tax=Chryseobacterium nematophagum TaxID=2305228 RepID=A0A3M7TID4_9FLAO|nr:T9SS type A sorting domain-containing protein [Chryseobacterium nematophagum]RNA62854.1 T9SS C-terminal target domain-containing protein [Chryseobacterium nematophagum]